MKLTHYIYLLGTSFALLTASCDDDIIPRYTVGEENNAIVLGAGIMDGGSGAGVQTRAAGDVYVPFSAQTQLRLRMDGTWTGHDPESVSQMTTAKTAESATEKIDGDVNDKHAVEFGNGEHLYWDDYGTADPANASTGRTTGLTIFGVAVEGKSTLPNSTPADLTSETLSWTALSWNVGTVSDSKISQKNGWGDYDLITSNNIRPTTNGGDGNYTFVKATANPRTNNLLKFTHAMTKITVNLTADVGFPGYDNGVENAKFQKEPEVTLLGFNYIGSVSVEAKTSVPTESSTTNIEMWRDKGKTWATGGQHTSQFTALVFPGNTFADNVDIIKLVVDGNTLNVNATKINTANTETNNTFEQGKNYIFNIIVKKTGVIVTATIKDWEDVSAEEEAPKINVNEVYGHPAQNGHPTFTQSFDLYRSTNVEGSYLGTGDHAVVSHADSKYSMTPQLYWPNHNTHYFFRGVWPLVDSKDGSHAQLGPTQAQVKANAVDVQNTAYKEGYYPSDLMIGRPLNDDDKTPDETCKVHTSPETQGICATEGNVHINFRYVMSQVEVELKTVTDPASATVNINENTVVELVNVYNSGEVKLSDSSVGTTGEKGNYTLNSVSITGNELKRHSAIVPQTLTFTEKGAETNLRFKITVTNNDAVLYADAAEYNAAKGTSLDDAAFAALTDEQKTKTPATIDVYYADVNPILKSGSTTEKVAPNGMWESGVHYKYVLTLSKTAITVTATLKDWVTVTASDNVWF